MRRAVALWLMLALSGCATPAFAHAKTPASHYGWRGPRLQINGHPPVADGLGTMVA